MRRNIHTAETVVFGKGQIVEMGKKLSKEENGHGGGGGGGPAQQIGHSNNQKKLPNNGSNKDLKNLGKGGNQSPTEVANGEGLLMILSPMR